ncbi:MAG: histidine phosphatase family protein, partial [Sandaracinaceae bacterium]
METFGEAIEVEVDDALDENQGVVLTRLLFDDLVYREDDLGSLARDARDLKGGIQSFLPLFRRVMRHWSHGELDHPEVESYRLFRGRVEQCVAGLHPGDDGGAVASTTGGTVRAAVAGALGLGDTHGVDLMFSVQNASVVSRWRRRGPRTRRETTRPSLRHARPRARACSKPLSESWS